MSLPKVSCLTITRSRPDRLRRAVECYRRQTWPNRELVVVVDCRSDTGWVDAFLREHGARDVRVDVPPAVEHLGALRNRSVELAEGEFVCVWDDDDLYHHRRIEAQAEFLLSLKASASFLLDSMHYFEDSGDLFLVRWGNIGLPPSMLCEKAVLPRYADRIVDPELGQKGSDTPVQEQILRTRKVAMLKGAPHLYTRVYHGSNVWNRMHHVGIAFTLAAEQSLLDRLLPGLGERLAEYLPHPLPAAVTLSDGTKRPLLAPAAPPA